MVREKDKEYIYKYLPEDKWEEGMDLLERGVAPQYVVGNVDFFGNLIEVNSHVLIPRFETELLVDRILFYIRRIFESDLEKLNILDIGTGSGCIAISLKKELNSHVMGVDISSLALEVAKRNAFRNSADVDFVLSDIFSNVFSSFDVIVSNPPYIREDEVVEKIVLDNEPHIALYAKEDGLYFYHEILKNASKYLNHKFLIAFEIGVEQGDRIKDFAREYLGDVNVLIENDYSNRERFVFIYRN